MKSAKGVVTLWAILAATAAGAATLTQAPSPVVMADAINAHLGGFATQSGAALDPMTLLTPSVIRAISAPKLSERFSMAVLIKGLSGSKKDYEALESYVGSADAKNRPDLGPSAVAAMKPWYAAVQRDPGVKQQYKSALKQLSAAASATPKLLRAVFDNDRQSDAAEATAPVQAGSAAASRTRLAAGGKKTAAAASAPAAPVQQAQAPSDLERIGEIVVDSVAGAAASIAPIVEARVAQAVGAAAPVITETRARAEETFNAGRALLQEKVEQARGLFSIARTLADLRRKK